MSAVAKRRPERQTVEHNPDGSITIVRNVFEAPDSLVAFPFGLEEETARGLIDSRELPARKLGRKWYARNSDVLALVGPRPKEEAPTKGPTLASIAGRMGGKK